jgi:formylglycine-generating enzyme required for sulfatase activity
MLARPARPATPCTPSIQVLRQLEIMAIIDRMKISAAEANNLSFLMRPLVRTLVLLSVAVLTLLGCFLRAQESAKLGSLATTAVRMEFAAIPPGEFMMGCSTGDQQCADDEDPRHRVRITKGFEIGKYEVTQAQWLALMPNNPSANKGDNRPVETVSKLESQEFIAKLNAQNDGYLYRLPTEAEWEYAARAGLDAPFSGPLDEVAWYSANSGDETHPVGQKKPNAWGLYDMQGNVREWVSDLYSANYYSASPAADPTGPAPGAFGRGGQGGRGQGGRGRGGRGFGCGQEPVSAALPDPVELPPGATQQQQIDALRQEVAQLREALRQLFAAPPFPGFVGGRGGPGGDGAPRGLPVARGGGWDQSATFQRVSARYSYYGPTLRVSDIGFRVVRQRVPSAQ